jgi:UDP-2,3-diacylglucosamine pyrophosphatase LpxH
LKKFLLSDLHIGHKAAQYEVMERVMEYIRQEARAGDELWGLGDWFHMYENGFEDCLTHPMTLKFRELARELPTKLVPGNHDHILEKYRDDPKLGNPISPIEIIRPFLDGGIWYCHGHEYDPSVQYVPAPVRWLINRLPLPSKRITPGNFRGKEISEPYVMLVNLVHTRALLDLREKAKKEHRDYKGIVLGHTHPPLYQQSPELLFLLNDGDMRHSATFTVEDEKEFRQLTWNAVEHQWQVIHVPRP